MQGVSIGTDAEIDCDASIGYGPKQTGNHTHIGADARVRAGTIIYANVEIGDDFRTGHHAVVREGTRIGDDVLVGTDVVVDGAATIGSHVSLQTGCYVPRETSIGDRVFIGPHAVLTNDRYPVRQEDELEGPIIAADVTIGANATVLPGVEVGANAFVGAGAVVTEDVPADTLAVGAPATHESLPPECERRNQLV